MPVLAATAQLPTGYCTVPQPKAVDTAVGNSKGELKLSGWMGCPGAELKRGGRLRAHTPWAPATRGRCTARTGGASAGHGVCTCHMFQARAPYEQSGTGVDKSRPCMRVNPVSGAAQMWTLVCMCGSSEQYSTAQAFFPPILPAGARVCVCVHL